MKYLRETKGKRRSLFWARLPNGRYESLGHDRGSAEARLRSLLSTQPAPKTIADMCHGFLADPGDLTSKTVGNYRDSLERRVLPVFGALLPSDFRPMHKAQYLKTSREKGRPVLGNKDMTALASAFNWGMANGICESNPCRGVRRNTERPRRRAVQPAEFNALSALAKSRGHSIYMAALIAATVALTGRRRAEVLRLPLSAATDAGIVCRDVKNQARQYVIEWSDMLRQVVAEARAIPRRTGSLFLFPNHDGQPYVDSGFCTNWQRLMRAYVAAGGERFTAHDLRSLYVTEKLRRGEDPETHQNKATMERVYNRRTAIRVKPIA
jgi:integrase